MELSKYVCQVFVLRLHFIGYPWSILDKRAAVCAEISHPSDGAASLHFLGLIWVLNRYQTTVSIRVCFVHGRLGIIGIVCIMGDKNTWHHISHIACLVKLIWLLIVQKL